MIYDSLKNANSYESLIPGISEAVSLLLSGALDLSIGSHTLSIPNFRYNVVEYQTLVGDKEFEIHKREADVQIMLSGREYSYSALDSYDYNSLSYDEEKDVAFVQLEPLSRVELNESMMAIYLPNEPHKPGLAIDNSTLVKKLVFKVKM